MRNVYTPELKLEVYAARICRRFYLNKQFVEWNVTLWFNEILIVFIVLLWISVCWRMCPGSLTGSGAAGRKSNLARLPRVRIVFLMGGRLHWVRWSRPIYYRWTQGVDWLLWLGLLACRWYSDVNGTHNRFVTHSMQHHHCYPRRSRSAIGVDIVFTLDVCMFVCLYVC